MNKEECLSDDDLDWMRDAGHLVPLNDLAEHLTSKDCWCRPTLDKSDGLYIHQSMDRREDYENGKLKLH